MFISAIPHSPTRSVRSGHGAPWPYYTPPVEVPGCGQEEVVGVAGTPEPDPPVDAGGDERPTWGNKLQNLLSCVGFAVGLGNLRRSRTCARPTGEARPLVGSELRLALPLRDRRFPSACRPSRLSWSLVGNLGSVSFRAQETGKAELVTTHATSSGRAGILALSRADSQSSSRDRSTGGRPDPGLPGASRRPLSQVRVSATLRTLGIGRLQTFHPQPYPLSGLPGPGAWEPLSCEVRLPAVQTFLSGLAWCVPHPAPPGLVERRVRVGLSEIHQRAAVYSGPPDGAVCPASPVLRCPFCSQGRGTKCLQVPAHRCPPVPGASGASTEAESLRNLTFSFNAALPFCCYMEDTRLAGQTAPLADRRVFSGAFLIPYPIAWPSRAARSSPSSASGQRLHRASIGVWTAISPYMGACISSGFEPADTGGALMQRCRGLGSGIPVEDLDARCGGRGGRPAPAQQQAVPYRPAHACRAACPRSSRTRGDRAEGRPSSPCTLEVGAAVRDPNVTIQACDTPGGCRPSESPTWKQPEAGGEPNVAQPGEHRVAGKMTGCLRADAARGRPAGRQREPFGAM
ncbi:hypothetical protein J1605_020807 [Eschrichtius robustus]|uniref:Uncharacterized protein n=1 Tax=Eschrichtius robustus TaxID=9764 RepID=A0AB34HJ31_ESCRO|nr:hypothetical protein J1605_020807 [Eschrichtius robustus]